MQRPPDLHERVARIGEKMAAREEVDALRARIDSQQATARWLRGTVSAAVVAAGFLALLPVFTR